MNFNPSYKAQYFRGLVITGRAAIGTPMGLNGGSGLEPRRESLT